MLCIFLIRRNRNKIPGVGSVVPGEQLLGQLDSWLREEVEDNAYRDMPNTLLTPLVVLTHLNQYWRYLEPHRTRGPEATDPQVELVRESQTTSNKFETLGFCTGLLSAFAVASARNWAEFKQYGATAIRLAMIVGALVDAQEAWSKKNKYDGDGPSKSYALAWRTTEQREEMDRIMGNVGSKAYGV